MLDKVGLFVTFLPKSIQPLPAEKGALTSLLEEKGSSQKVSEGEGSLGGKQMRKADVIMKARG